MIDWKTFEVDEAFPRVKNKKVKAVYVTAENADAVAEETKCFAKFNDHCVCTGVMSLARIPSWLVNINPKGKVKKYIFESEQAVNRFFKEETK